MSPPDDASFWHTAVQWAWSMLALPIAYVWKRSVNSVQKAEWHPAVERIEERLDQQGQSLARIEGYLQGRREHNERRQAQR
jgi:hypothetical protein